MSRILSARDVSFLLFDWLHVESLCARERFKDHSKGTFAGFLEVSEQLAARHFASHNALSDRNEPQLDGEQVRIIPEVGAALAAFNEAGLVSAAMDGTVGGLQLPHVVHRACFLWFQAANTGTAGYPLLSMGNANLLLAYASLELVERFVPGIAQGRFFGTMCLSEPEAGSSLADVTTTAEPQNDGTHRLCGTKMWISGGEHDLSENIVHLVLARHAGGPPGVHGLSLYAVPKFLVEADGSPGERNDVMITGINHKMGYRGTVNTVLQFGDGAHTPGGRSGAVGYLVGDEGRGLAQMFHMMNEARIAVGAGAVALGYTGYLHALDYARTREQGRLLGQSDPTTPQVPIIRHPDVRRMLLASKCYVEGGLALVLYAARLLDEEETGESAQDREEAHLLLDLLTPIVKSWPSMWCLVANDHAIQVYGGYGYARDYPVEQFYRDNRLNPIHEGTHGVQGRDLLGRKVVMQGGAALRLPLARMRETAHRAAAAHPDQATVLAHTADRIQQVTDVLWSDGDRETALANSSHYLDAVGHAVVAWLWLEQILAAGDRPGDFYAGKRLAMRYFFDFELPRIDPQLDLLATRSRLLVDLDDGVL